MQDFIQLAANTLGIGEGQARTATGGVLSLLAQYGDAGDVSKLFAKVPGAEALANQVEDDATGPSTGLMGAITGALGSGFGEQFTDTLQILQQVQETGLQSDSFEKLTGLLFDYLKQKAGPQLVAQLTAKLPDLFKLFQKAA